MLRANTLRLLHRLLDDFVLIGKVRSGTMTVVQLENLLRYSGGDAREIQNIVTEYRQYRSELGRGLKPQE